MATIERLYDESETTKVRFIGFSTDDFRYDFGIIYTNQFFGKPMVVCMQSGCSTLLDGEDIQDYEQLKKIFRLKNDKQAMDLAVFFEQNLPTSRFETQYD
ncbi:DUF3055 domain-containing protein [Calidifontibacillus erzurumensis]|uniref:DUF3055 domain-containing protein n=1 Tax=Calidifontibacillus erzurumensis TaxID=2741433 RepID=A0A8J8K7G6_9BACI|nr:DUF3055 domain-containing protein [Calidifontibacillus erzurumensis]NSL50721.1 DUF3055 domain-containing protein [Calidifontibacillus erzurumensis]